MFCLPCLFGVLVWGFCDERTSRASSPFTYTHTELLLVVATGLLVSDSLCSFVCLLIPCITWRYFNIVQLNVWVCVVGCLPHFKEMIMFWFACICLFMCVCMCACEWACALLLHRRNGPTKFLEKSYYHMYTGVGWSEMFMFLFTFLYSRVFTTCGLFCLRGVWLFTNVLRADGVVSQCCQQRVVSFVFSAISAGLFSYEASSVDWLSVVLVVVVLVGVASTTAAAFVVIIAIVEVVVSTNDEAR